MMAQWTAASEPPCALRSYLTKTQKKLNILSPAECTLAFQHWVAYERPESNGLAFKDRYKCPISTCPYNHANLDSLIKHVVVCQSLEAATYLCPRHNRDELFQPNFGGPLACGKSLKRIRLKLKRALLFFKNFGFRRQGCPDDTVPPPPQRPLELDGIRVGQGYPDDAQRPLELDGVIVGYNDYFKTAFALEPKVCAVELPSRRGTLSRSCRHSLHSRCELEAQRTSRRSLHDLNTESDALQCADTEDYEEFNGASGNLNRAKSHRPIWDNSTQSVAPSISILSQRSPLGSTTPRLFSPISPLSDATNADSAKPEIPMTDVLKAPAHDYLMMEPTNDRGPLELVQSYSMSDNHAIEDQPHEDTVNDTVRLQDRILELRGIFRILCHQWRPRVSYDADLLRGIHVLSNAESFEQGLQVLQGVINGELPRTFEANLSLALVATACGYALYEDRDLGYWDDLLQNIMQWRNTIDDPNDKRLFVRFMANVKTQQTDCHIHIYPVSGTSTMGQHNGISEQLSKTPNSQSNYLIAPERTPVVQQSPKSIDLSNLLNELRMGVVFDTCLEFFDDAAYARVFETSAKDQRGALLPAPRNDETRQDLICSIISSLERYPEMGVFHDKINEARKNIEDDVLCNPREVEVFLLSHCMKICPSRVIYRRVREIIFSVCDPVMSGGRSKWRTADLVNIIIISREIGQRVHSVTIPTYEEAIAHPLNCKRPRYESNVASSSMDLHHPAPPLTNDTPSSSTMRSCLSTLTESTNDADLWDESNPGASSRGVTSTPPSSQSSPTSKVQCSICPEELTSSNLSRHKKIHQPPSNQNRCPILSCSSRPFTRRDNLRKHVRRHHPGVTLETQDISRKRKVSGDEPPSE